MNAKQTLKQNNKCPIVKISCHNHFSHSKLNMLQTQKAKDNTISAFLTKIE